MLVFFKGFSQPNYIKSVSTYYGDENMIIRDSQTDSQGNIVLLGEVELSTVDQYTIATLGSHQFTYGGGISDCFITKFSSTGEILWSTYLGGEAEDRTYSFCIDKDDNIIILGSTKSNTNIATPNTFQPNKSGIVDHFISKFNPLGQVIWSTYFGGNDITNQQEIKETEEHFTYPTISTDRLTNDIFFTTKTYTPNMATSGVFQETSGNNMIVKFSGTGEKIWATYYGINSSSIYSIQSDSTGVYVLGVSFDCPPIYQFNTYFATSNCHQPLPGNCKDLYLTKFDAINGTRVWSTYYGGAVSELASKKSLLLTGNSIYIAGITGSNTNISTPTAFQPTKNAGSTIFISKFSTDGVREWGTYYGNPNFNTSNTIDFCGLSYYNENLYISGLTYLNDEFSTTNSFQENYAGGADGFLLKFNPAGERQWATYFGGSGYDLIERTLFNGESIYLLGMTKNTQNISTPNSSQPGFLFNNNPSVFSPSNIFIAKLEPNPLSIIQKIIQNLSIFPNPNNGTFSISNLEKEGFIEIYDILGKKVHEQSINNNQVVNIQTVSKGIYFAKIKSGDNIYKTEKIIVN